MTPRTTASSCLLSDLEAIRSETSPENRAQTPRSAALSYSTTLRLSRPNPGRRLPRCCWDGARRRALGIRRRHPRTCRDRDPNHCPKMGRFADPPHTDRSEHALRETQLDERQDSALAIRKLRMDGANVGANLSAMLQAGNSGFVTSQRLIRPNLELLWTRRAASHSSWPDFRGEISEPSRSTPKGVGFSGLQGRARVRRVPFRSAVFPGRR